MKQELIKQYLNKRVHVIIRDPYHPIDAIGYVNHIDDMCNIHGTWGGLAVVLPEDSIEVIEPTVCFISSPLSVDKPMFVEDEDGFIFRIAEGTGDALEEKDIEDGYVDYIYYDIFASLEDLYDQQTYDGGVILLKKPYKEHTVEEILAEVCEFCNCSWNNLN